MIEYIHFLARRSQREECRTTTAMSQVMSSTLPSKKCGALDAQGVS